MRFKLPSTVKGDFVVVDSTFPQKYPFAFRNSEINEYLERVDNVTAYAMHRMYPGKDAAFAHGYGVDEGDFKENKAGYLQHYPQHGPKIEYLKENRRYKAKLAYSFFLAETFVLLPFFEKNHIPFVFVLYPGGLFGLNSKESDEMLKKICCSKYFRAVIVTQEITQKYLLDQKLCPKGKIHYIYGGFVQFKKEDVEPKKRYPGNKKTFDICFVAAKYSEKGIDKGYDLFIETAKLLAANHDDIRFHVVGGFDEADADVSGLKGKIKFYGYQKPSFLAKFYAKMDIFLAPNRPFKLYGGNFDGFPLGIDASYCGVALFVADELKMNSHYKNNEEIVIIPLSATKISRRIEEYYKNPEALYNLSSSGQHRTQTLFDINHQIEERIKVFSRYVTLNTRHAGKEADNNDH